MPELSWALDVSNYQPKDLGPLIAEHNPDHVLVRLNMPWEMIDPSITPAQVASVRAHNVRLGGYLWFYRSIAPVRMIDAAIDLCARINLVLPMLWLDCEIVRNRQGQVTDPGPTVAQVRAAIAYCRELGVPVGLYTGAWWVQDHVEGKWAAWAEFADIPHWVSDYDGRPDLGVLDPKWQGFNVVGKQWSGDPDRSVFLKEYTVEPLPMPPLDPCAQLRADFAELQAKHDQLTDALRDLVATHA